MNVSHASVHPAEYPPTTDAGEGGGGGGNIEVPRVRMKDFQGMPGTQGGLALRICQFVFAAVGLCIMATTSDFPSVTAFCDDEDLQNLYGDADAINEIYLVAATGLQSLWSLSLAIIDIYALLVMRSLQNYRVVTFFTIGDGSTLIRVTFVNYVEPSAMPSRLTLVESSNCSEYFPPPIASTLTFAAACSSAGITVLIDNDLDICSQNHCVQFETATAMAFISWFTTLPSFLFNLWSLASR
ncbi:hypothetical protein Godav_025301 [Gossypium davidsonii]|uniref:CASP-like protein n=1 Tax=Gossypium davidsonii TaxID=34287 RepID=A0A7J8T5U2_GOSDV|nr:hypothetical protein [Gossypium davidsonii]